jgi:predicted aspartyl protease
MGTVLIIIVFCLVVGIPLYYMFTHIGKVIKRNYIFDIKMVKKNGDKLEFNNDYNNHKIPVIKLCFEGEKYNFLIDTGADVNLLNKSVFNEITKGNVETLTNGMIQTASSEVKSEKADLSFKYINKQFTENFVLFDLDVAFKNMLIDRNIQLHGVLGSEFFKKHRWSVDFDNMVIWTK